MAAARLAFPRSPQTQLPGNDAPGQVAAALDARRRDYAADERFTWPTAS